MCKKDQKKLAYGVSKVRPLTFLPQNSELFDYIIQGTTLNVTYDYMLQQRTTIRSKS